METVFMEKRVTTDEILAVIREYDKVFPDTNHYRNWLDSDNYDYTLIYSSNLCPPKYILSRATGIPLSKFSGGKFKASVILGELGFDVRPKTEALLRKFRKRK